MPRVVISDRDRVFTIALWQELFRLADVKLHMSSSYHPQTDGQTERLNQCLEAFLRCTVHAAPTKWSQWLAQAQHWYNTSYHSALNTTPFEILFARKPTHFEFVHLGTIQYLMFRCGFKSGDISMKFFIINWFGLSRE